ncbi:Uncharacterized protein QTN25_001221 [Entamoeba marina]
MTTTPPVVVANDSKEIAKKNSDKVKKIAITFNDDDMWVDVTNDFVEYYSAFPDGDFRGDEEFALNKTLRSIEVFNPLMDVGHLLAGNYTSEELQNAGLLKDIMSFTELEMIELFDTLRLLELLYMHGKLYCHSLQSCDYVNFFSTLKTCESFYLSIVECGFEEEEMDPIRPNIPHVEYEELYALLGSLISKDDISSDMKVRLQYRLDLLKSFESLSVGTPTPFPTTPTCLKNENKNLIRGDLYARDKNQVPNIRRFEFPSLEEMLKVYELDRIHVEEMLKVTKIDRLLIPFAGLNNLTYCSTDILPRAVGRKVMLKGLPDKAKANMLSFGLPKHRVDIEKDFFQRLGLVWTDALKLVTHNKAHFYRNLPILLEVWELTHGDAASFDVQQIKKYAPPSYKESYIVPGHYLNGYIMEVKFFFMAKFLMIGCELELYEPHEYHMVYWYMSIILTMMNDHYNELRIQLDMDRRLHSVTRKAKSVRPSKLTPTKDQLVIQLYRYIIHGISHLLFALKKYKTIETPSFLLGNNQLRYDLRFAAFKKVHVPQFIPYDKYLEQTNVNANPSMIIAEAIRDFNSAKDLLQQLKTDDSQHLYIPVHMKDLLYRVVMSNLLTSMKLAKTPPKTTTTVSFSFEAIKYLPIITLKDK